MQLLHESKYEPLQRRDIAFRRKSSLPPWQPTQVTQSRKPSKGKVRLVVKGRYSGIPVVMWEIHRQENLYYYNKWESFVSPHYGR